MAACISSPKSYLDYSIDQIDQKFKADHFQAKGPADEMRSVIENEEKVQKNYTTTVPIALLLSIPTISFVVSNFSPVIGVPVCLISAATIGIFTYDSRQRKLASDIILQKISLVSLSRNYKIMDHHRKITLKMTLENTILWKHLFANRAYSPGDIGLFGC